MYKSKFRGYAVVFESTGGKLGCVSSDSHSGGYFYLNTSGIVETVSDPAKISSRLAFAKGEQEKKGEWY